MPMKRAWSLNAAASEVIGKVEVFEPKIASLPITFCVREITSSLTLRSSNTASTTRSQSFSSTKSAVGVIRDSTRIAIGSAHRAATDLIGDQLFRMRLARCRDVWIAIDQHDVQPGERADIGDARAHEARAEHADRLQRLLRHFRRAAHAGIEILHGNEQRADHRRGLRRAQHVGEPARLHPQSRIHRQLQALIDDLHDGVRGRIIVIGLAAIERVRRRKEIHPGFGVDRAGRQPEAVAVPRRFGACRRP